MMQNKNNRPVSWMPRPGDLVDYHPVIGEEAASMEHMVLSVLVSHCGEPVVHISGKNGYVHCDALTPSIRPGRPDHPGLWWWQASNTIVGEEFVDKAGIGLCSMLNSLTPEEYECGGNFERWLGTGKRLDIFLELDTLDYYLAERYFAGVTSQHEDHRKHEECMDVFRQWKWVTGSKTVEETNEAIGFCPVSVDKK